MTTMSVETGPGHMRNLSFFMFVQLQLSILCALVELINLPVSGHIGQYLIPKTIERIWQVI